MQTNLKEDKTMREIDNGNERMYNPDSVYDRSSSGENMYDSNSYGTDRYGSKSYGAGAYETNSYGTNSYNTNPYVTRSEETNTHKMNQSGTNPIGPSAPKKNTRKKKTSSHPFGKAVALGLVFGIVAGTTFGGINYGISKLTNKQNNEEIVKEAESGNGTIETVSVDSSKNSDGSLNDVSDIAAKVQPAIVSINTKMTTTYQYFFETYQQESSGAGSGIIVGKTEDSLYVATNYHVIQGATEISVGFNDGTLVNANVKGYNSKLDIAVIEIPLEDLTSDTIDAISIAAIGNSDTLKVGEAAIAMGNALGIGQSVTVGYVSALNRTISSHDGTFIQTDAAINPGNSGGALVNAAGEVIGITNSKYVDSSIEGVGFAIPINTAMQAIDDIITGENKGQGYLGISAVTIDQEYREIYGFPTGVYIKTVYEGSPAETAGLHSGDIIYNFDGQDVSSREDLEQLIKGKSAGDEVTIKAYRANSRGYYEDQELTVTLGESDS